jgi:hypothetical protein
MIDIVVSIIDKLLSTIFPPILISIYMQNWKVAKLSTDKNPN